MSMKTSKELSKELEEVRQQLFEATETLHAIRSGQVDALFVENEKGKQLYTLKTADQTYRVFIEKMKEGAVTLNRNEIILYCNTQFAKMVGLPSEKVIGLSFTEFISKTDLGHFKKLIERGWESDSKGELSLKNHQEESIPFLLSFTSLELDEGISLSVILTDLSMQKESEKELKSKNDQLEDARHKVWAINEKLEDIVEERTKDLLISREHFKFLADNIPVIVWTTEADGFADYFNKRWYEYTGLNFETSKGRHFHNVIFPEDLEIAKKSWENALANQSPFEFQLRLKRSADESYRWFLGKSRPVKDEDGNLVAWFNTLTDIEDQKKEMEKKDEFISVASHELKTPLTSLKGYIQLIELNKELPSPVGQYIKKANDSINKLQHLINDLLDVSKIHAGKLKFNVEEIDLSTVIKNCIESSGYIYSSHKIKNEARTTIKVLGNAERLEQVIMNLISNAVKYSPESNEIVIQSAVEHDKATVSVIDFGIGMSAEDQKKIFERFYRIDSTSLFTSGLGMGLYISAEIIKEHNGLMNVKSKINQGSIISFSLPILK